MKDMFPRSLCYAGTRRILSSAARVRGANRTTLSRFVHATRSPGSVASLRTLTPGLVITAASIVAGTGLYYVSDFMMHSHPILNDSSSIDNLEAFPEGLKDNHPLRKFDSVYELVPGLRKDMPMKEKMETLLKFYQKEIVAAIEHADSSSQKFITDEWSRGEGLGGGITRVFQDGRVFEKGGVNFSAIYGTLPPAAVQRMKANHKDIQIPESSKLPFYACGLSLVIHPRHYLAPSVHMNYRYFETRNDDGTPQAWWFGGGQDLSPMYYNEADAVHFHALLKDVCDHHDPTYYQRFKKWADDYFLIKYRGEARGIGGIFFDDLNEKEAEQHFLFVADALSRFLPSYLPAVRRAYEMSDEPRPTPEEGKHWQGLRRGRYVEFNLAVDRGTSFGLQTPGSRVESILMTLPKNASWEYNYHPTPGSLEAKTVEVLKNPKDYV
ncbi:Coproporphyrinogen III oxidase [Lipomyces orientalis]|uniref:Coproporphyrinogen III oxidase n=1 Tax=Lipomyces orientalis TaxID=1233043 RepID=A0ACC3TZ39_9ASCO